MESVYIAIEVYFITFVVAFMIAVLIKAMQKILRVISSKKEVRKRESEVAA